MCDIKEVANVSHGVINHECWLHVPDSYGIIKFHIDTDENGQQKLSTGFCCAYPPELCETMNEEEMSRISELAMNEASRFFFALNVL